MERHVETQKKISKALWSCNSNNKTFLGIMFIQGTPQYSTGRAGLLPPRPGRRISGSRWMDGWMFILKMAAVRDEY